ncbi:hypothetical protein HY384_01500 [Candidatus Daviesbacteria bacterium]|nr:hypothetical protein [Candidatus Daviesbacteria bacterium]
MNSQKGTSLTELLLVVVVVGVIIVLMANLPNAVGLITKSYHLSLVREIVAKQIEDKRTISFVNLVNGTSAIADSRFSLLPAGVGTVVVEDCSVQICTNGESLKKITVTVSWKESNKVQTASLDTFIGEGGINQ